PLHDALPISRSPTVTGRRALRREDSGIPPPAAPPRFPDPLSPFFGPTPILHHRPDQGRQGPWRADPGPGCAPRRHRGDVEVRTTLPHTLTVRVRAGQRGFGDLR